MTDCPTCGHTLDIVLAISAEDMRSLRPNAMDFVDMGKVRKMVNKNIIVDMGFCSYGHGLVKLKPENANV